MDVAGEIADLESQEGRNEDGITLWKAYRFPSEAVGILMTQNACSSEDQVELGIRWLVGHPTMKGAEVVLMAKADELHRTAKYAKSPMHVTASASSVGWYKTKGFVVTEPATCNDDVTPCGCAMMQKPPPTIEIKVWRPKAKDPLAEGLMQLDSYLAGLGLDTGWLVIFDRRSKRKRSGETRAESTTTQTPSGRRVIVVRA